MEADHETMHSAARVDIESGSRILLRSLDSGCSTGNEHREYAGNRLRCAQNRTRDVNCLDIPGGVRDGDWAGIVGSRTWERTLCQSITPCSVFPFFSCVSLPNSDPWEDWSLRWNQKSRLVLALPTWHLVSGGNEAGEWTV